MENEEKELVPKNNVDGNNIVVALMKMAEGKEPQADEAEAAEATAVAAPVREKTEAEMLEEMVARQKAEEEQRKERKRANDNAYQRRWRKKGTFIRAVVDFQKRLQKRSGVMDANVLAEINSQLYNIQRLPYRWTDTDLERSWAALKALEKKYLGRNAIKFDKGEAVALSSVLNTLEVSHLSNLQKANVALEVLTSTGRDLFISAGDGLDPSPEAALVLLTQDTGGTLPKWFAGSLADLLEKHLTRADIHKFLLELSSVLRDRDKEKYGASDAVAQKVELQQEIDDSIGGAIDGAQALNEAKRALMG